MIKTAIGSNTVVSNAKQMHLLDSCGRQQVVSIVAVPFTIKII